MISKIIHRPILASVVSLIILFLGIITLFRLPVEQFPNIAPPEVTIELEYPGANAVAVTRAAVVPIEKAVNGVPGMKYIFTDTGNDGTSVIKVVFETGTDPDIAAVNIQNRVAEVTPVLPPDVVKNGIKIKKMSSAILMYLNIFSNDTTLDEKFMYNFAQLNVFEELKRVNGVGFIDVLGAKEYAMRIWLKPDKMLAYNVSTNEIDNALEEQNIEAAPGKIGESSDQPGKAQALQYTVLYTGKFTTKEQYENIPLKATSDGKILHIKDVADVELGTSFFDVAAKFNGRPCAAIMIKQTPGSNANEVISNIKAKMKELKEEKFLKGMDYEMSYDVSRFLDASIHEVLKTFIEALLLVTLVVFVFLQNWKATLISTLAIPISLVGAFFFMQFIGFSLNLITLFSLVLAIGIVVDNAIVVVEAVHAKMERTGMNAKHSTEAAMKEISGAIIAITLVMTAVFIPVAFMKGPSGIFYRQFSLTLAIAIVLSGVVALSLTPALCAMLLEKPRKHKKTRFAGFFNGFDKWYSGLEFKYKKMLERIAGRRIITWGALIVFLIATGIIGEILPKGFIPNEDQGIIYASIITPPGATLDRTKKVVEAVQREVEKNKDVESVSSLAGTNILSDGTGPIYGTCLINLKDWRKRHTSVNDIIKTFEERTAYIKDADVEFFSPPPVPGYGNAGGYEMVLLDKTGSDDQKKMEEVTNNFVAKLNASPQIGSAYSFFNASFPQYTLHVDMDKATQKGVTVNDAMSSLQTLLGSDYASNFIRWGQLNKVMVQAYPEYRATPDDLMKLYVKNDNNEMVPMSSFMSMEKTIGVDQVDRYNLYLCAQINGDGKPGVSSGDVLNAIQKVAKDNLPRGYGIDWMGVSKDEASAGNEAFIIFLISLVFVYLILSGQYESFLLPLPVILSLPAGIFGSLFMLRLMGLENNIYAQIAMIMLIGLLGKNAILIVEFAINKHREGIAPFQAAIEGARLRLRPILMTSFAFMAGLLPLVFATGAGAVGNRTIGTAAFGGMFVGTLFGVIIIPGLYVVFATVSDKLRGNVKDEEPFTEQFKTI